MAKLRFLFATLVLLAVGGSSALAQQRRVTGQVTEAGGQPLVATTVQVVGTTLGALTNEEGRFTIQASEGPLQLRVRRIGYRARIVPVAAGQEEVNIQLERDVLQLEKQVVTGVATSVASVNAAQDVVVLSADQINAAPTPTVENALQGKIAGAQISQNSGAPGGGLQVRLRGVTSLYGSSDPLYVVDGVIVSNSVIQPGLNAVSAASGGNSSSSQDNGVNRIADLNPADIETMEILKGASASSIYGAKASNGVIIITTKAGRTGKTDVNVTQRVGTFTLANKFDQRKFATVDEAIAYDQERADGGLIGEDAVRANYAACGGFCDHQEELFGNNELSYETNLSVRGGTAATRFFASGLVKRDGGIAPNTGYNKQSLRLNLQQTVSPKLTMNVNTNLAHTLTSRGLSNNDNVNATPYFVWGNTPSYYNLRPTNGIYPENPYGGSNPLQTFDLLRTPEEVWRLIGSASTTYLAMTNERQSLSFTLQGGVDQFSQEDNILAPRELQFEGNDGFPGTVIAQNGVNVNTNYQLTGVHKFNGGSGMFEATTSAGLQAERSAQRTTLVTTRDVPSGTGSVDLGAASDPDANRFLRKDLAFYLNEDVLTLSDRLLLGAGVRAQRSSVNGDFNKFYLYPKLSGSYRLGAILPRVSELKIRAAAGRAGNLPQFFTKFTPLSVSNYDGNVGIGGGTVLGNANVVPEQSTEVEAGFDVTAFDSRVSLNVTGYQKSVSDLLLQPLLAPSQGYTQRYTNGGKLRNRGTEVQLAITAVQTADLNVTSRTTFSRNVGVVTELPGGIAFNIPGSFGYGNYRIQEGQSPTSIFGSDADGNDVKYGDTYPDFIFGFSNEVTYKGVRVYGLLDWQKGGANINITDNVYDEANLAANEADRDARIEACDDVGDCSVYVQDASFVKLREITLGYTIPASLTGRLFGGNTRGVRAELSGRNLVTWTPYRGLDPEVSNFGNQNVIRNADLAPFPPTRSFFFSLSVDF